MKSFCDIYDTTDWPAIFNQIKSATIDDVDRVLSKQTHTYDDFLVLLSPAAEARLEEMAQQSHALTLQRFGKTIKMYVPIYISNVCHSLCVYCGFRHDNKSERTTLTREQVITEAHYLADEGFHHLLLLTGDARKECSPEFIADAISAVNDIMTSMCIEVYPMDEDEYVLQVQAGADGMTLYQETYNKELYKKVHLKGKKKDFYYRLETPERAARAGMRNISIGALLGLHDWREEAAVIGAHLDFLWKNYWHTSFSLSLPRMVEAEAQFAPLAPVSVNNMVQFLTAVRLFIPDTGVNVSTREDAETRMNLLPIGVTSMSAGSSTRPGGYSTVNASEEQFSVHDTRSPHAVAEAIRQAGYEPVWKDWDHILTGVHR